MPRNFSPDSKEESLAAPEITDENQIDETPERNILEDAGFR
jgi:hypothetical protein